MARKNNVRTVMLTDEVFTGLKTAATVQHTSVSRILENIAREYLAKNATEIQQALQRQMSLFEINSDDSVQPN